MSKIHEAFENGKAAMRLMGSWFANNVYTDDAATIKPEEVVALKIPTIADGKGEATDYCAPLLYLLYKYSILYNPYDSDPNSIYIVFPYLLTVFLLFHS